MGCRWSGAPNPAPVPKLSAPTLAAASLELKAEKQSAHSGNIWSVAFSPDGKTIVSGSSDKTLKVWDAGASALIPQNPQPNLTAPVLAAASLELKAEKQSAHSGPWEYPWGLPVAFSPDGKTIVSGAGDKSIKVWDASVSTPAWAWGLRTQ